MSERLLRFTRNDNVQCAIKVHGRCHCEGLFRSNLPAFIKEIWLRLCRAMNGNAAYRCMSISICRTLSSSTVSSGNFSNSALIT
ncbi:MAG: hypothetical protein HCAMLNBO_00160 [Candidatus Brocadia fulgida]|nr:hypothetical protein [Candidatus Brocadia fulgida]